MNYNQQQQLQTDVNIDTRTPVTKICTEKNTEKALQLLRKIKQQANFNNYGNTASLYQQLNLLERTLDCNLFKSVCQVYDQVYESCDFTNPTELKASAVSQATVALFASSISQTHPRTIELPKSSDGLGFNVMSYEGSPVFISQITPGGVADSHGGLQKGDQLVSINGINVEQADHTAAVELLKEAKNKVVLVVKYMPGLLNEIESSYIIKQHQNDSNCAQ